MIVSAQPAERGIRIDLIVNRQRGQVQAGRPPLGPADERLHRAEVELEARIAQHDRRLGGHHREVLDANLDQSAARAQPPERKRRLGP